MAEKSLRGFASMDKTKQREIASKGGKAAHQKGTAHEFTPDEARAAGRKGGESVSRNRLHMSTIDRKGGEAVSRDRTHMSAIGREGGHSRGRARQQPSTGGSDFEQSERPSYIGQERANDRGVTGEAERGAGGLSPRHDRNESGLHNDRGSA